MQAQPGNVETTLSQEGFMRVFNELVFNGYVKGTEAVYSEPRFQELLGVADRLSIGGYTAQVIGTTPQLTVDIEQSADKERWLPRTTTPAISAVSLSAAPLETPVHGHDGETAPDVFPRLAFVRLKVTLSGTGTLAAQVRLWAAGRD